MTASRLLYRLLPESTRRELQAHKITIRLIIEINVIWFVLNGILWTSYNLYFVRMSFYQLITSASFGVFWAMVEPNLFLAFYAYYKKKRPNLRRSLVITEVT